MRIKIRYCEITADGDVDSAKAIVEKAEETDEVYVDVQTVVKDDTDTAEGTSEGGTAEGSTEKTKPKKSQSGSTAGGGHK